MKVGRKGRDGEKGWNEGRKVGKKGRHGRKERMKQDMEERW